MVGVVQAFDAVCLAVFVGRAVHDHVEVGEVIDSGKKNCRVIGIADTIALAACVGRADSQNGEFVQLGTG